MTMRMFCGVYLSLLAACGGGGGGGGSGSGGGPRPTPVVNEPPSADFDLYQDGGHGPLTVSMDAGSSRDPEGGVLAYEWDFGNRRMASGVAASHTYAETGTYTISLTVTDPAGASSQTSQRVTVDVEELVCVAAE